MYIIVMYMCMCIIIIFWHSPMTVSHTEGVQLGGMRSGMEVDVQNQEECHLSKVWHVQGKQYQCIEISLGEMWKGQSLFGVSC